MNLDGLIQQWMEFENGKAPARLLRVGLYLIVAYSILILGWPNHEYLWGEHALIAPMTFPDLWTNDIIMFLHKESYRSWYPLFMVLPFVGMAIVFFTRWTRVGALLVFIGTSVLFNRSYTYLTGGNYLLHLLLFYLVFIDEKENGSSTKAKCSNILSNFGQWACRLQVIIVYLFTGAYKMAGETWRSGEAVYIITHVDEFTLPFIENGIAEIHWLMVVANYMALVYFFTFPFLVWSKRWKLPLLLSGAFFHLTLGIVIGVFDFSLIMIASYAAFLDDESIQRISSILPIKKRAMTHH